jgi:hypothetical protein
MRCSLLRELAVFLIRTHPVNQMQRNTVDDV